MAVWPVLESSPNFFSAGVQLSEGLPLLLLANWAIAMGMVIAKLLQQILFGELRLLEVEHIYERSRFEVVNSLIALTMFSNDWLLIPGILTLILLFVKLFHWLLSDRFESIFQRATVPRDVLLTRNTVTLLILLYTDFTMVYSCAEYTFGNNPDVYFAFGFEFVLLFLELFSLTVKIGLNTWELHHLSKNPQEESMEAKNFYMKLLKLTHTALSLSVHTFLLFTFLRPYRFPIYLFKDIFMNSMGLVKQINELRNYLKTARELDAKLPDATEDDINEDNNLCIICRDDMTTEGLTKGQRLHPKKLPCSHIIHMGCLKGWLEISQVCPMCRAPVFNNTTSLNMQRQEQQPQEAPQQNPQNNADPILHGIAEAPIAPHLPHVSHDPEFFQAHPQAQTQTQVQQQAQQVSSEAEDILTLAHNSLIPPDWTLFKLSNREDNQFELHLSPTTTATITKVDQEPTVASLLRFRGKQGKEADIDELD
jgi:E3 ubiquitin-protein ligase synoviolin